MGSKKTKAKKIGLAKWSSIGAFGAFDSGSNPLGAICCTIASFARLSGDEHEGRRLSEPNPAQEKLIAWTGTVLDFGDETLKERIVLNNDGTIASSRAFGKKDKIVLPHSSAYTKDLPDKCMPLIAYLHGVEDPKRELPDYAYVRVDANGIKPVVRGGWLVDRHGDGRVLVRADYGPAYGGFAAWQVDEKRPEGVITPQEYAEMQRRLEASTVLVE